MYENLMEEVVTDENCALALAAVKRFARIFFQFA